MVSTQFKVMAAGACTLMLPMVVGLVIIIGKAFLALLGIIGVRSASVSDYLALSGVLAFAAMVVLVAALTPRRR